MLKYVSTLCAALVAALAFAGSSSEANAGYRRCVNCGPIAPSYTYRTVNKVSHQVRYRDVTRVRHVERIHPVVHVTRVQPIVRLHTVTRVHHRTVPIVRHVHSARTVYMPTRYYSTGSVRHSYDCGCY